MGGGLIIWAGAFFVFRLPLFGPFVLLGCLSFLRPNEWAWAMERIGSVVGRSVSRKGAEPKKMAVVAGKDTNIKK